MKISLKRTATTDDKDYLLVVVVQNVIMLILRLCHLMINKYILFAYVSMLTFML